MTTPSICKVDGCDKPSNVPAASAKDFCPSHYRRWKKHGDALAGGTFKTRGGTVCTVDGCENRAHAQGYCPKHYSLFKQHGSPTAHHPDHRCNERWIDEHKGYDGDDCIAWPFSRGDQGRGTAWRNGRQISAPRAMCFAAHGEPPTPEHQAAHSCGNGHLGCMNPRHIRWATRLENAADRCAHGMTVKGSRVNTSKLSENQVREIRARQGLATARGLGREYGVSSTAISLIWKRENWGWLK